MQLALQLLTSGSEIKRKNFFFSIFVTAFSLSVLIPFSFIPREGEDQVPRTCSERLPGRVSQGLRALQRLPGEPWDPAQVQNGLLQASVGPVRAGGCLCHMPPRLLG